MVRPQVNYDRLAATYNQRFSAGAPASTTIALHQLAGEINPQAILEVGCGTGYWLAGLQHAFPTARCCGLDLSAGMLRQAQQRGNNVSLLRARAEQMALLSHSFDLVYTINAIHHFTQPQSYLQEARRLLRPGGALLVMGMTPSAPEEYYPYQYFPGVYETDLERFPSWGQLLDWCQASGFTNVRWRLVETLDQSMRGEAIFDDPFLPQHATSQLALLSPEAYAQGLERIRQRLAQSSQNTQSVIFPVILRFYALICQAA